MVCIYILQYMNKDSQLLFFPGDFVFLLSFHILIYQECRWGLISGSFPGMEHFRDNGSRSCLETKEMEDNIASSLSPKTTSRIAVESSAKWKNWRKFGGMENCPLTRWLWKWLFSFLHSIDHVVGRKICLHLSRKCDFKKYTEVFF